MAVAAYRRVEVEHTLATTWPATARAFRVSAASRITDGCCFCATVLACDLVLAFILVRRKSATFHDSLEPIG